MAANDREQPERLHDESACRGVKIKTWTASCPSHLARRRASSAALARVQGQKGWAAMTRVGRSRSGASRLPAGQCGTAWPEWPGVASFAWKARNPPMTANPQARAAIEAIGPEAG